MSTRRIRIALAAAALTALSVALATPPTVDGFTVVMLPDTQFYSQTAANFPNFQAQTNWVLQNKVLEDIAFVTHVGDIVQSGASFPIEWQRASSAMGTLDGAGGIPFDGHVPYGAALGNHDFDVVSNKTNSSQYVANFGPARYSNRSWYLGSTPNGRNHAQRFLADGREFVHLTLEWRAADYALEWARGILAQWPNTPAIISTHEHLNTGNPGARTSGGATVDSSGDNSAEQVYRKLVEPFPQVFLVLCGHIFGNGRRSDTTIFGETTFEVLADFQSDPNGGNGWLQRLLFRPALAELEFKTFSPTYVAGVTSGPNRAVDPASNFTLSFDLDAHRAALLENTVLRFGQGADFGFGTYAGAVDTHVGDGDAGVSLPSTAYGAALNLRVDGDEDNEQGLLRFDGIVGLAPGQIPPGTTIERAVLTLTAEGANANSGTGAALHRMLVPWSETSSFTSLGAGVQLGVEALASPDALTGAIFSSKGTRSFDVTPSVQAWVNGAVNHGWVLVASGTDRIEFRSSNWGQGAERPLLTVRFASECPTPARFCPVTSNSFSPLGARIGWQGTTSVSANNFTLTAERVPPGKSALFFYGSQRARAPFADGYRCVAAPLLRLAPPSNADAQGAVARVLDFGSAPLNSGAGQVTAGAVFSFQCWYRDPQGPGGAGSNFSDALEVRFCP
jgi:hypothetical protein